MKAVLSACKKEALILLRDRSGLILLFLMPAMLVLIMSLLQDSALRKINDDGIPMLVINEDKDSIGNKFIAELRRTNVFQITEDSILPGKDLAAYLQDKGYMAYIHIPAGASAAVRKSSALLMAKIMSSYNGIAPAEDSLKTLNIDIFTDPTLSKSQVLAINAGLERILLQLQGDEMISSLYRQGSGTPAKSKQALTLSEVKSTTEIVPNAVQHNVPAWAIFSMFFIVVPLAGSLVSERNEGSLFRLRTIPDAIRNVLLAKSVVYLTVGICQMMFLLLIGLYLLPLFGLPALQTGNQYHLILLTTFCISFAASCFGLMFGTVASTHQQASIGGAVTVLVLAALGGIWVPVYLMPAVMQKISLISPLNWGLEAFHGIFLRQANFMQIAGELVALLSCGIVCLIVTIRFSEYKNSL